MPEKFLLSQKISQELKKQRTYHGLSQEKMALKCNVDRKYLYTMEMGKTNISCDMLQKLCNGFEISMEQFFKNINI
jgi:transcriptional regulator with XRE-family HTH domain